MTRSSIDKSTIFLLSMFVILIAAVIIIALSLRTDPIESAVNEKKMINIALIYEKNGKPISTELLLYYPGFGTASILDIPPDTGLLIKSIDRVDRIDVMYNPNSPSDYLNEVKKLCDAQIDYYIIFNEKALIDVVDLLEGLSLSIPNRVETNIDGKIAYLPHGLVVLDGEKSNIYASYKPLENEDHEDSANRRQSLFLALIRKITEKKDFVLQKDAFNIIYSRLKTDLKADSMYLLFSELTRIEADRMGQLKLTGSYRSVEGNLLLFPLQDGETIKDIVKKEIGGLVSNIGLNDTEKVLYKLEILNGTSTQGLAKKTSDIFKGYGYDVSVDNADNMNYEFTEVLDNYGNENVAKTLADIIRCTNIKRGQVTNTSPADFVIILGKDFNGRYCN